MRHGTDKNINIQPHSIDKIINKLREFVVLGFIAITRLNLLAVSAGVALKSYFEQVCSPDLDLECLAVLDLECLAVLGVVLLGVLLKET